MEKNAKQLNCMVVHVTQPSKQPKQHSTCITYNTIQYVNI